MKFSLPIVALAAIVSVVPATTEAQQASGSDVVIKHCVVSLIDEAQIPAQFSNRVEGGVIRELPVQEGTMVKKGDILAQFDDREAKFMRELTAMELESARKEASNDVNIQAARKTKEVADAEYDEGVDINRRSPGSVPQAELRRLKLTAERAELQIEVAQMEFEVAGITEKSRAMQLELADVNLDKLQITSPIDGVVVKRYKHLGEWVGSGEPVMHIVGMNKLRIEGFVDAAKHAPQDIKGKPVTVEVELTQGRTVKYNASLEYVSPIVEASNDYRVWVELENKRVQSFWELRPGLPATITVHVN